MCVIYMLFVFSIIGFLSESMREFADQSILSIQHAYRFKTKAEEIMEVTLRPMIAHCFSI